MALCVFIQWQGRSGLPEVWGGCDNMHDVLEWKLISLWDPPLSTMSAIWVNMNFRKEVTQNQSSFHSSRSFWPTAFPKSPVRTLFCLFTRSSALAAMSAPHVSASAALSSIWRVQQFCRCSSLLPVLVLTLQMAFRLSVYRPIILEYQVWSLGQGNYCSCL